MASFVERAILKNAINSVKPDSVELEGAEKIYSPKVIDMGQKLGDASAMALAYQMANNVTDKSINKIKNYLEEANKPETVNALDRLVAENKEIMSQPPSAKGQSKLISNTIEEVQYPRDNIADIEMDLKNNPHLSDQEQKIIINDALKRFNLDQKALNNLEATRPDAGTIGHSIDVGIGFGKMLKYMNPNISPELLDAKIKAAMLHDYGKGTVRYRDLISSLKFKDNPDLGLGIKKPEVDTHTIRGAESLDNLGETVAAYYARNHHSNSFTLEEELLKAMDIYNSRTGKRVYRDTQTSEDALKDMQKFNVGDKPDKISPEVFDLFKNFVESGVIDKPTNYESDLNKVYQTKAGDAISKKGIKLFDVDNYKNTPMDKATRALNNFSGAVSAITNGKGFTHLSNSIFDRATKRAKVNALMEIYRDKDPLTYKNLQHGVYNDKTIDQLFAKNIDEIKNKIIE